MRRVAFASLYAVAFLAQYQFLTVPAFAYWGFAPLHGLLECLWLISAMVAPAPFLPERIEKPSELFGFLNFSVIYVPACVLLTHSTLTSIAGADQAAILCVLASCSIALFLVPRLGAIAWVKPAVPAGLIVALCWGLLGTVVLVVLVSNPVHAIGFKGIGGARLAYARNVAFWGPWFAYADSWSFLALVPFLFSFYVQKGKWHAVALLCGVCLLFFFVSGRKTSLLSPLVVIGTCFAVKARWRPPALLLVFWVLLWMPFALVAVASYRAGLLWVNVVNFRIFAVPQVLIPQYYAYYAAHGFTHFRHVNLVNRLLYGGRAFEQPWSVIARFYYHKVFTADAVFYATDGLAAMGLWGIPCISVLVALMLWVFDSLQGRHSPQLLLPALMPFFFSLCNNSLFTSMLTGGGLVLMLLFYCLPERP